MSRAQSTGKYSAWLDKIQDGEGNARALLTKKLRDSNDSVSPIKAATDIMNDELTIIKEKTNRVFEDLNNKIKANEEAAAKSTQGLQARSPGEASTDLTEKLKKVDLATENGQKEAVEITKELISRDDTLQPNLAHVIRGKLWEDTKSQHPTADPKELAKEYNGYQTALADKADEDLVKKLKLDQPSINPNVKKSIADTFTELAVVAEKLSPDATIKKLEAKTAALTTTKGLIDTDVENLKAKLNASHDTYEQDPAKRKGLEVALEKTREAQKDLSETIDDLTSYKTILENEKPNPEKNEGLTKAMTAANTALRIIEEETPFINHATHGNTAKLKDFTEIGTKELMEVCETYKDNKSTGEVLKTFAASVNALNAAIAELKKISEKLATPELMKAYETQYKAAVNKVDTCCATIERQMKDKAAANLIETAYKSENKKDALEGITTALSKLNEDAINLRRESDGSIAPKTVAKKMGQERPGFDPLGADSVFMQMAKTVAPKRMEERETADRKKNAEALQKYYTFSHKVYDRETGKYETTPIMDNSKPPKPVNLSLEEVKGLIAKINADPKNAGKKPIELIKKGDGYEIECHTSKRKNEVMHEMIAFQDNKLGNKPRSNVKEGAAPTEVTEKKVEEFKPTASDGALKNSAGKSITPTLEPAINITRPTT